MTSLDELLPYPAQRAVRQPVVLYCLACCITRRYVHPRTAELAGWNLLHRVSDDIMHGLCPTCYTGRTF